MAQRRKQSNPKPLKWDETSGEAAGDGSRNADREVGEATGKSPNPPAIDEQRSTKKAETEGESELVEGPESSTSSSTSSSSSSPPADSSRRKSTNKESDLTVQTRTKDENIGRAREASSKRVKREEFQQQGSWQKSPRRRSSPQHHNREGNCSPSESSGSLDNEDENSQPAKDRRGGSETPELLASPDLTSNSAQLGHQQRVIHPYLHLLPPAMRNDAARLLLMPPILPPELAAAAAAAAASIAPAAAAASNQGIDSLSQQQQQQFLLRSEKPADNPRSANVFVCEPCSIKFSSAKTLEAHQTYYCSFRKDSNGKDGEKVDGECKIERGDSRCSALGKKRERMSSGDDTCDYGGNDLRSDGLEEHSGSGKNLKTGKLYPCSYCSYSADKKVSLNRHMRIHSGPQQPNIPTQAGSNCPSNSNNNSSASIPTEEALESSSSRDGSGKIEGGTALERYCNDCDIQFSSIKTYRVHKQYYCSTRHVLKAQQQLVAAAAAAGVGTTPVPLTSTPGSDSGLKTPGGDKMLPEGSHHHHHQRHQRFNSFSSPSTSSETAMGPLGDSMGSQPFVMLPTNPVIIVPYCFLQAASILPSNVLPTQNALVVLPNGCVKCLPSTATPMAITTPLATAASSPPLVPPVGAIVGLNTAVQHPSSSSSSETPGASLSPVFNDPKDIIRKICASRNTQNEPTSHPNHSASSLRSASMESIHTELVMDMEAGDHHHQHHHPPPDHLVRSDSSHGGTETDYQPAIDLTLRSSNVTVKRETQGDDEKENRGIGFSISGQADTHDRDGGSTNEVGLNSPSERISIGSGSGNDRRGSRPSSVSVSSSCSTPPALCEPKLNGKPNLASPSPVSGGRAGVLQMPGGGGSGTNKYPASAIISQDQSEQQSEVKSKLSSSSSSVRSNGQDKISPIATQLPGGAILTRANGLSLADLLLSSPPDVQQSLAKLNPGLLISPPGGAALNPSFLSALSPDLALRFLDPAYLASLQHSFQQQVQTQHQLQQQQQQQGALQQQQQRPSGSTATGPGALPATKRGVSKCHECDIAFYKYENYVVHKEHYCAARLNNNTSSSTLAASRTKDEVAEVSNGTPQQGLSRSEIEDSVSPPGSKSGRQKATRSSVSSIRSNPLMSPESCRENGIPTSFVAKSKSPCSLTASPTASPSSIKSSEGEKHQSSSSSQSQQHPCLRCGISFSSLDTLSTHQTYYCRERMENSRGPPEIGSGVVVEHIVKTEVAEKSFIRCPKCRLTLPEDQGTLHSQICSGKRNSSSNPTAATTGWKCPCCDIYSPTMSAAQKHLETHTGIRAFKCLLCGYRGNTLRGMRTHIRMHFDKRASDLQEGDYIACITANNENESNSPIVHNAVTSSGGNSTRSNSTIADDRKDTIDVSMGSTDSMDVSEMSERASLLLGTTGIPRQLSPGNLADGVGDGEMKMDNNNRVHSCALCSYTSSYKGNVVRHMKLVHKISEDLLGDEAGSSGGVMGPDPVDLSDSNCQDYSSKELDESGSQLRMLHA